MKRVTQADIAKALDLSPATVALVVGQSNSHLRHCLREETVERIREKAREMGYHLNRAAQITRSGRSNLIVHLNRAGYSEIAALTSYHIGRLTHKAGFDYQSIDSYWWGEGQEVPARVLSLQPEGVIVSGMVQTEMDFTPLRAARIPMVSLGLQIEGVPWVRYEVRSAVASLTRHCLCAGRHPVMILRGPGRHFWQIIERQQGFLDALREAGFSGIPEQEIHDDVWDGTSPAILRDLDQGNLFHPFNAGMRMAHLILESGCLPSALICTNDHYAIGVMTVLLREGVRIPEEVAVTGFDNLDYTTQGIVSLTSVEQPIEAICESTVGIMKKLIGKPARYSKSAEEVVHPCRIHWRKSTDFGKRDSGKSVPTEAFTENTQPILVS